MKNKMIKLIATDFDGTLVHFENEPYNSSWDALGSLLDEEKKQKWYNIRDYHISKLKNCSKQDNSKIYADWFDSQLSLLKGYTEDFFKEKILPLKYSEGAKEFFSIAKKRGKIIGILSSGIDFIVEEAARELEMDFCLSTLICKEEEIFTGKGISIVNLENKLEHLKKICKNYKVNIEEVCYFGDNFNCEPVLKVVGLGIAFNPKTEETAKSAKHIIYDFREALPIIENYELKRK